MDESPLGLISEVETEVRHDRSDSSPIRRWEARFREHLESTLSRLRDVDLSGENDADQ